MLVHVNAELDGFVSTSRSPWIVPMGKIDAVVSGFQLPQSDVFGAITLVFSLSDRDCLRQLESILFTRKNRLEIKIRF